MLRTSLYTLVVVAGLILTFYLLQPTKQGIGYNANVRYEQVENWLNLPKDFKLGNPSGIGIDKNQQVVVLHRTDREWPMFGPMPSSLIKSNTVLVIDNVTGKLKRSWGANLFIMPHGLKMDEENNVWITDVALHQVFKFSSDGRLIMKLGEAGVAGSDSLHFNKPTDVAFSRDGSIFVSDGYGNSRVVKFSATGKYLFQWGKKGQGEGEFNIPHGLTVDPFDNVYVADRENNRVQKFDSNGKFIGQFTSDSFGAIGAVAFNHRQAKLIAVDDLSFLKLKHRGSDVLIFDSAGNVQTRFGRSGFYEGETSWYHSLTMDDGENIYVGGILKNTIEKFRKTH